MPKAQRKGRSTLPGRLGTGEWGTKEDFANEAREIFLREIQKSAQVVIRRFLEQVWPEFDSARKTSRKSGDIRKMPIGRSQPEPVRRAIYAWARACQLLQDDRVPQWLCNQVNSTLSIWEGYEPVRTAKPLSWGGIFTGYRAVDRFSDQDQRIILPEFTWHPQRDFECRESVESAALGIIKAALTKRLDEIEEMAMNRGLVRAPEVRQPDHFNWTVRYQILGERTTDIAGSLNSGRCDVRKVNSGIKKVLSWVGISRRPERPGPVSKS